MAAAAFALVWGEGRDPQSPETAAALACALGVSPDAGNDPAVKDRLRSNTEAAVAAGVYGVPTLAIGHAVVLGPRCHADGAGLSCGSRPVR